MRLTIVSSRSVELTDSGYKVEPLFGTYVEGYLKGFDEVTVCAPLTEQHVPSHTYTLNSPRVHIQPIPTKANRIVNYSTAFRTMFINSKNWEEVLLFLPSWMGVLGFLAMGARRRLGTSYVYIAGDWGEVYRRQTEREGYLIRWAGTALAHAVDLVTRCIVRNVRLTMVAGDAIFQKLHASPPKALIKAHPVFNLTWASIYERMDTCQEQAIKCLFVGLLVDNKGLQYLIPAVGRLRKSGVNVSLTVVGEGQQRLKYQALAKELGIDNVCVFTGYVAHGEALFDYYRAADIFILPSLTEGFPRVIYEAMGHGLPVIATHVGGIPAELCTGINGILVSPRSTDELVYAVQQLVMNPELRREIIRQGYMSARPLWRRSPSDDLIGWYSHNGGISNR